MNNRLPFYCLLLIVLLMLSACSEKPAITKSDIDPELEILWQKRQSELQTIKQWVLTGRIAVKTEQDAWTASIKWEQGDEQSRLRIVAPFHGIYEIKRQGSNFILITPEKEFLITDEPESVMQENLGWSLPITALESWIIGLPANNISIEGRSLNKFAQLTTLRQSGWLVEMTAYKSNNKTTLPGKLIVQNDNAKITVLANQWSGVK